MIPPTIRVKKGGVVYDDSDQKPPPRPSPPPPRRRLAPRRRGPASVMAPLLVVGIGIFILFRVAPDITVSRRVLAGWQATIRVTPDRNDLLVGITFVSISARPSGSPEATAVISLGGTEERTTVAARLSRSPMTLWGRLPAVAGARRVRAVVTIGNARVTLSAALAASRP